MKMKPVCECGGELADRKAGNQYGRWIVVYCKKCGEILGHYRTVTGDKKANQK